MKPLAVLLLSATLAAQDKDRWEPLPAYRYAARQTNENVTIAAEPFETREKQKPAFGKRDLTKLGVLPILVVVQNDSDSALQLENMRVEWMTADRQRIEPIPASDVPLSGQVKRPDLAPRPSPIPRIGGRGGQPQDYLEIEAREFVAPMVPARGMAHGFFYFRVGKGPNRLPGSKLYITGIRSARTGQELLYYEINLNDYVARK